MVLVQRSILIKQIGKLNFKTFFFIIDNSYLTVTNSYQLNTAIQSKFSSLVSGHHSVLNGNIKLTKVTSAWREPATMSQFNNRMWNKHCTCIWCNVVQPFEIKIIRFNLKYQNYGINLKYTASNVSKELHSLCR